jgi:hypothetical protein
MAFKIHHTKDGSVPPWEYLPMNAATYKVGDAAVMVGGYLTTVASGSGQDTDEGPHYVVMAEAVVAADGDAGVPCVKANPNIVWETTLSAADADIAIGLKYCIHTDGRQHDGTTTKGCFELESFAGTAKGDLCTGVLV